MPSLVPIYMYMYFIYFIYFIQNSEGTESYIIKSMSLTSVFWQLSSLPRGNNIISVLHSLLENVILLSKQVYIPSFLFLKYNKYITYMLFCTLLFTLGKS